MNPLRYYESRVNYYLYELDELLFSLERGTFLSRPRGLLENGIMYTFNYNTNKEPFFDSRPIVIGLGKNSGDKHSKGINLHYIPFENRNLLLSDLIIFFNSFYKNELVTGRTRRLNIPIYNTVGKELQNRYNIKYAIKNYDKKNIRGLRMIKFESWPLAVLNNENYFVNKSIFQVQNEYYNN